MRGAAHFTACELHFAADWTRHNHSISYKCWIINRKNTHNLFGSNNTKQKMVNKPTVHIDVQIWMTNSHHFHILQQISVIHREQKWLTTYSNFFCLKYAASQFMRQLISLFSAAYFIRIVHFGLIWTSGLFISRLFCSYLCTRWPSV